ncbi:prolyl oligopeptidase family serine peptidase [Rhodocytophaga aerolata]|uniref:Prolyl oligopeptidase family serine peptidase n=1 Tax=Rhodocytophaga aerolata TaxID=455078 RepID=A0ABT8R537_9BACT|nr:prolyl oligopeptidase family serine peptidase [Rhodocytophaga aerolata]MDO1446353.1 prolyl oligopeptidase family serine peptidase [Rhodocytophaga aerolata]
MHTFSYPYALYYPPGFSDQLQRKWPLILFLHGAGERGHDMEKVKAQGLPAYLQHKDIPFLVAYPQCPAGQYWSVEKLSNWLQEVLEKLDERVDEKRIYLTGISMGGYGTWRWAAAAPDKFAAIAPICGGGDPALAVQIKDVPIWAFHGEKDYIVPLSETAKMVEAVEKLGGHVTFTRYPDAAHDSWTETYHNPLLYDWFLTFSRSYNRN